MKRWKHEQVRLARLEKQILSGVDDLESLIWNKEKRIGKGFVSREKERSHLVKKWEVEAVDFVELLEEIPCDG